MYSGIEHSTDNYSATERFLHKIAFASPKLQRVLAQVESDLCARQLESIRPGAPVFVTGLPRAGTTLVLDILYRTGAFATFTYRSMPFPLAPLLWQRLSRPFQKQATLQQRAHGDGMEVSVESPEAFEEVIWLNALQDTYVREDHLLPLGSKDVDAEFAAFFKETIRKLIAVEARGGNQNGLRYLSKNNANISRIPVLRDMFPEASVIVCFRNPLSHCRSLAGQHERFLQMHDKDPFSRDYMRWIGHYDFGSNFRPIDFNCEGFVRPNVTDDSFWLHYWLNAYRQFDTNRSDPSVHLFCYDDLLAAPAPSLAALSNAIELHAGLDGEAERIRAPHASGEGKLDASEDLVSEAMDLYAALCSRAVTGRYSTGARLRSVISDRTTDQLQTDKDDRLPGGARTRSNR